ncbi:hypothetical protein CWIS_13555 [Cellulomonas sp. A375-1]|uniref:hypothetical protein n=1 Tax=Cellulomonas sp. A375-1 TaxID=1672219 RepID=UPI0006528251|nr:hypothetical protein [Cellulomonas sp. A375-1]KMM44855.1 hypothetical protein CWIS_13555 [Cellulomonas sp. A375-1]
MSAPVLIGTLGALQPVLALQAGSLAVSGQRASREIVTMGSVRKVQRAARSLRSWSLAFSPWTEPDTVALLEAAAQGILADLWLYDIAAAQANMLPPEYTCGAGAAVAVGSPYGTLKAHTGSRVVTVPVRPSTTYRFSSVCATTSGSTTLISVAFRTAAGVATGSGVTVSTSAQSATVTTSSTAAYAILTISSTLPHAGTRMAQATSGTTFADAGGFLPGQGSPTRVSITDPERVLQHLRAGAHGRSAYTFTALEVGKAGSLT